MAMLFAATYPERTTALITIGAYSRRIWDPDYPWAPTPEERQQFFDWIENNWGGNYGDAGKPPTGDPTFDGMYYDPQPEYHNPPSNQWFGYQTWPIERLAEYYYVTGNTEAQSILAKWVSWAESVTVASVMTSETLTPPPPAAGRWSVLRPGPTPGPGGRCTPSRGG